MGVVHFEPWLEKMSRRASIMRHAAGDLLRGTCVRSQLCRAGLLSPTKRKLSGRGFSWKIETAGILAWNARPVRLGSLPFGGDFNRCPCPGEHDSFWNPTVKRQNQAWDPSSGSASIEVLPEASATQEELCLGHISSYQLATYRRHTTINGT